MATNLIASQIQPPDQVKTLLQGLSRPVAGGYEQAQVPLFGIIFLPEAQQSHLGMEEAERSVGQDRQVRYPGNSYLPVVTIQHERQGKSPLRRAA